MYILVFNYALFVHFFKLLYFFRSGIYISDECGSAELELNHGVLAVGYGVVADLGAPYWIVKNR